MSGSTPSTTGYRVPLSCPPLGEGMRLPTHHPGPGLNHQHLSPHHVVAAATLQVGCTMGKRILIQVVYPLLKLYWFLVRPKTFGV